MRTNNNNNEINNARVVDIVKNEGRIIAAIKKGNHDTAEIMEAADMFTEYREFCEAIAALQVVGMVECLEDGYYLTEKGEYLTAYDLEEAAETMAEEAANADRIEKEREAAKESNQNEPTTAETVEVVNEVITAPTMKKYRVTTTTGEKVKSLDLHSKDAAMTFYNNCRSIYQKHGFQLVDAGGNGETLCELWTKDGYKDRNIELYPVTA